MKYLISSLLLFFSAMAYSQDLTDEETKLYNMINDYRKSKGLHAIPLSKSLTKVAKLHVQDLVENKPDNGYGCNPHSWSDKGEWSACCYTPDHKQSKCMWDKPRELTKYTGDGFEIAVGENACCSDFAMSADYALSSWKKSPGHNQVIVSSGMWSAGMFKWQAIGVALDGPFAVVWFGAKEDPDK